MKRLLPILASVCLAVLFVSSVFAAAAPQSAVDVAAKPTKPANHPGQGHGNSGNPGNSGQARGRGGPCGQPPKPKGTMPAAQPGKVHYDGILEAVGADSVTISTTLSGTVTLAVTEATCIRMPPAKGVALSALSAGMRVGVHAAPDAGGTMTALRIQVHKPRKITYAGTVTAYTAGSSLTLQPEDGSSPLSFTINSATDIKPWHRADAIVVGSEVTVQAMRDFAGPNPPILKLIVHGEDDDD